MTIVLVAAAPTQAQTESEPIPCLYDWTTGFSHPGFADAVRGDDLASKCADSRTIDWDKWINVLRQAIPNFARLPANDPGSQLLQDSRKALEMAKKEKQHLLEMQQQRSADQTQTRSETDSPPAGTPPAGTVSDATRLGLDWRPVVKPMSESETQRRQREEFERKRAAEAAAKQRSADQPTVPQRIERLQRTVEVNEETLRRFQARKNATPAARHEGVPVTPTEPLRGSTLAPRSYPDSDEEILFDDELLLSVDKTAIRDVSAQLRSVPASTLLTLQRALYAYQMAKARHPNVASVKEQTALDNARAQVIRDLEQRAPTARTRWLIEEFRSRSSFEAHVVPALEGRIPPGR